MNSLSARVPRFLPWLSSNRPDVVCPAGDEARRCGFRRRRRGRTSTRWAMSGPTTGRGSGTAWRCSRGSDSTTGEGLPRHARLSRPRIGRGACRLGGATGARLLLYVPNGREVGSDHYDYKLTWLKALRDAVLSAGPSSTIVRGDINIAPPTTTCSIRRPSPGTRTSPMWSGRRWPRSSTPDSSTSSVRGGRGAGLQPTGTTAPGCSTRTSGCAST